VPVEGSLTLRGGINSTHFYTHQYIFLVLLAPLTVHICKVKVKLYLYLTNHHAMKISLLLKHHTMKM